MKYQFSQQVRILGEVFKVGVREVSEEVEKHPHFMNYVKCGWVKEAADQSRTTGESVLERAKKLEARLMPPKPAAPVEPVAEPAEEPTFDTEKRSKGKPKKFASQE